MSEQVPSGGKSWWELTRLTRRAFLRATGLAAGLASAYLVGCSPSDQQTSQTLVHETSTRLPGLALPAALGVNIHPSPTLLADIAKLAEVGFRFVRLDLGWNVVERIKGHYDFSKYEPVIDTLVAHGIRPLCILDYSNALYEHTHALGHTVVGPHTDEVRQAFARFAKATVTHFKGQGIYWELWNEPDYTPFWYPAPLADDYMALVKLAIPVMRQADPQATIVAPALTGLEPQYQGAWTFIERCLVLGLPDLVDALSVHPYRRNAPEVATADYQRLRALLASSSHKGMPVISSEWGYSLTWVSPQEQAAYLVRLFLVNVLNGLPVSIWYDWRDDGGDPMQMEDNFGLLTQHGQPKPALTAAQTLISELAGFHFSTRVALPSDADYALTFLRGATQKEVLWTTGQPHTITLPLNASAATLTSMTGKISAQPTTHGRLALKLTNNPQYLTLISRENARHPMSRP